MDHQLVEEEGKKESCYCKCSIYTRAHTRLLYSSGTLVSLNNQALCLSPKTLYHSSGSNHVLYTAFPSLTMSQVFHGRWGGGGGVSCLFMTWAISFLGFQLENFWYCSKILSISIHYRKLLKCCLMLQLLNFIKDKFTPWFIWYNKMLVWWSSACVFLSCLV